MIFVSILKSRDRATECSITYKRRFKKILYAQTCPSKYDKRTRFYLNSFKEIFSKLCKTILNYSFISVP